MIAFAVPIPWCQLEYVDVVRYVSVCMFTSHEASYLHLACPQAFVLAPSQGLYQ